MVFGEGYGILKFFEVTTKALRSQRKHYYFKKRMLKEEQWI